MNADDQTHPTPDDVPDEGPAAADVEAGASTREAPGVDARRPDDRSAQARPDPDPGLYRSASDRVLLGVCGGVAERYGLEAWLVRFAFLVAFLLGGAGVLFYLAAAVLVPVEPVGAPPGGVRGRRAGGGALRALVAFAVAIAVLCALAVLAAAGFAATAVLGPWPVAIVVAGIGVVLLAAARSRRAAGALLVTALALAVPATVAVVAGVHVDRSVGDRQVRPTTSARAARGYRLGVGRLVVDLRALRPQPGDRVRIPASVDAGQLVVVLPRAACVAWDVRTRLGVGGTSSVLDRQVRRNSWPADAGSRRRVRIDPASPRGGNRRPRVTLDLRAGIGEILVDHRLRHGIGRVDDVVAPVDDVVRTDACRTARRRG